jgi:WD40 repeat protein
MARLRTQLEDRAVNRFLSSLFGVVLATSSFVRGQEAPVSFHRDVFPLLRANCVGCHKPSKSKGQLDLTTHAALMKGGKDGAAVHPGDAGSSRLIEDISGDEPAMPEDGEPLTRAEIALIERWIAEGAKDDTPEGPALHKLTAPPVYYSAPAVAALAWSPTGNLLAVAGYHEVLLHDPDGSEPVGRLVGNSPRVESLAFSSDGKLLAVAGGAASEYGEIQIWDVASRTLVRSIVTTTDSVFGVSFSPDASKVAVGCADKTVRAFSLSDGREVMKCDNHIDWVFATAFSGVERDWSPPAAIAR